MVGEVIAAEKELKRKLTALPRAVSSEHIQLLKEEMGPYKKSKL